MIEQLYLRDIVCVPPGLVLFGALKTYYAIMKGQC